MGYRILSTTFPIGKSSSRGMTRNINTFRHPILSEEELRYDTRFDIVSWADVECTGKHAFIEEFIKGKNNTAMGFFISLNL